MHETKKCYFYNLLTCYSLSIYHCIENNGTSLLDGQEEPKMSEKLCNETLKIVMVFQDMIALRLKI